MLRVSEPDVSYRDAAARYEALLVDGDTSFRAVTIEEVVGAAIAHGGATMDDFRRRYPWWTKPAS